MEKTISDLDRNFALEKEINKDGLNFFNIKNAPFKTYGVSTDGENYLRMPKEVAKTVSEGVESLNYHTAGGRVKFKTDSKKIAIITKQTHIGKMPHFAFSGSVGFDLYVKKNETEFYVGSFIPDTGVKDGFERTVCFENDGVNEFTINFPLYSGVSELLVGIEENAQITEADDYKIQKPVVYYGSSITQGGCASRPGNSYQAIVSRTFDCDYINLGFSGNCRAEDEIINYIKNLDMSVFVFDYDHNSPGPEHLAQTHEKGFKAIREQNPDLPIVVMSRPKYYLNDVEIKRLEVIKKTVDNAVAGGDKNVYFIDGKSLMNIAKDNGTVDGCHPNDLGFYSMAKALEETLEKIF